MTKSEALIIQRVGNGYTVRPASSLNQVLALDDLLVFNRMGWATADGQECLLTFIEQHFGAREVEP